MVPCRPCFPLRLPLFRRESARLSGPFLELTPHPSDRSGGARPSAVTHQQLVASLVVGWVRRPRPYAQPPQRQGLQWWPIGSVAPEPISGRPRGSSKRRPFARTRPAPSAHAPHYRLQAGIDVLFRVQHSVLPPLSVGEMTLRLYAALNYSQNSARDLRCALNGA